MRLFLRTIIENPTLGLEVQEVALGRYDASMQYSKPPSDLVKMYNEELTSFALSSEFHVALSQGSGDAEVVILLSRCPNIQTLSFIARPHGRKETWLSKILLQHWTHQLRANQFMSPTEQRLLPHLHHVTFEHFESEVGSYGSLDLVTPFLHLPHLLHLSTDMVGLPEQTKLLPQNAPWPLKSINVQNTFWRVQSISSLLQACPNLETLGLTAAEYDGYGTFCDLDFDLLGDVLRRHGTRLRRLTVDPRGAFGYTGDYGTYRSFLGSLKPLARLEHLSVPLAQLLEHGKDGADEDEDETALDDSVLAHLCREVLPESLTSLRLLHLQNKGA